VSDETVCRNCGIVLAYSPGKRWPYCQGCGTRLDKPKTKPPGQGERYMYKPLRVFMDGATAMKECEGCASAVAARAAY
jgi:hypothetical protein